MEEKMEATTVYLGYIGLYRDNGKVKIMEATIVLTPKSTVSHKLLNLKPVVGMIAYWLTIYLFFGPVSWALEKHPLRLSLLGGPWDLVTTYNWI